ncbi:hypothetical protein IW261DRAFT_64803 [Armillaria novae-zelandiae]|uniref:REJ domain-containing protein n=1 Tax=Armillaria novae-zelandiae TaxID=153914 RepID=A0AA39PW22_9AGAR|nr:hypothetical protein IW261DRAFT_64803 [Armillaria novae-zelandiae]
MEGQILAQRQALSGISSSVTSVVGDIGDAASSAASAVSTAILTSKTSSTSVSRTSSDSSASSTSNTSGSSSSTASSSSSSGSLTSSVSASETLSTALSSSSPDSATSSLPSSSVSESVYETTSDGVKHTVTAFASAAEESATSSSDAATQTGVTHKSFLQNKPLSGFVFALCGVVGLVLILLVVTFTLRRRRKNKLLNEAISFDPQGSAYHPEGDMEEKLTHQRTMNSIGGSVSGTQENGSSTGHGMYMPPAAHGYYDAGYSGQTGNAYTYATYAPTRSEARQPSYDHLGVTHNMGSLAFEDRSMSPPRPQVPAMGPPSDNFRQNYAYGLAQ